MSIIVPILSLITIFAPVFGYALYRSYRLVQLEQYARNLEVRNVLPGYSTQEVAAGLRLMANTGTSVKDYLPEECSFTQYNEDGFAFPMPVEETK